MKRISKYKEFVNEDIISDDILCEIYPDDRVVNSDDIVDRIDWERVSARYDGIEIDKPWGPVGHWLNAWDVSSGCIWNKRAVENVTKL